ncbi:unnamed protein product [Rotaria socialis]|uniref:Uncharacterized protein n=1 Tax=Rotaria socialis TaxID=392032 RepID=A0A821JCA0_9BILA|nr:unnamed protein product [Rotaria socialis]
MNNDSNKNFEQSNSIAADRAQGSFDEDLVTWGLRYDAYNFVFVASCKLKCISKTAGVSNILFLLCTPVVRSTAPHYGFYIIFPSFNLILFSNCQVQHRITITIRIEAPDHEPL